jgi:hypothetical protein
MDLELNMFEPDVQSMDRPDASELTKRSEAIAISTADSALRYTFLVKDVQRPELLVRTRVTEDRQLDVSTCKMTFQEARRFITARVKGQETCGLQLSNNGPLVLIREEVGHIKGDIPDPIALRTNIDVHATPTFLVIKKGAFQLVEFTLLFLKTTWFHCVCSCSIRQPRILIQSTDAKDPEEDYRYTYFTAATDGSCTLLKRHRA